MTGDGVMQADAPKRGQQTGGAKSWLYAVLAVGILVAFLFIFMAPFACMAGVMVPVLLLADMGVEPEWYEVSSAEGADPVDCVMVSVMGEKARVRFFVTPENESSNANFSCTITVYDFEDAKVVANETFFGVMSGTLEFKTDYEDGGDASKYVVEFEGTGLTYHILSIEEYSTYYY